MTTNLEPLTGIYLGDRGIAFKSLVANLLKKGGVKQKYIDLLTSEENLEHYGSAFTSELVDEVNNYQVFEQLGDLSGNKFIVQYIYERFPQLRCAEGVKVVARLRINLGSKNSFCAIAEQEGFWNFISATNDLRQRKKKPLLEDVFEAFLGVTEQILDDAFKIGVGYACVYKILKAIFDHIPISLRYEDLYDAKTRLKELMDIHGEKIGTLRYEEQRDELLSTTRIYLVNGPRKELLGQGSASLKADSEQSASTEALKTLAKKGIVKFTPAIYAKFSGEKEETKTTVQDVLKICQSEAKINEQFFTKGKSKYQNKYTSTPIIAFCKKKDYRGIKECIKMGADPNLSDSDGNTAMDALLIGKFLPKLVGKVLKLLDEHHLALHRNVYEVYGRKYCLCEEKLIILD